MIGNITELDPIQRSGLLFAMSRGTVGGRVVSSGLRPGAGVVPQTKAPVGSGHGTDYAQAWSMPKADAGHTEVQLDSETPRPKGGAVGKCPRSVPA
ncbi:hypothetical protein ACFOVU_14890 [Nocardiopsis sediminis]|uniref:Uncharacterized protein n=1 Tax=Nocardiopsis sediminis TaxID=1778267 RepID=A0ABV8FR78_9ACTN